MKAIFIEWVDALWVNGVMSLAEAKKQEALTTWSIGHLVTEDADNVTIAQDHWRDGEQLLFRHLSVIPKVLIQQRIEWEVNPQPLQMVREGA